MKKQLLLLTALAFASVGSFAQTTLFNDNFDAPNLPSPAVYIGTGVTGGPAVSPNTTNLSFSGAALSTSTVTSLAGYSYTGFNSGLWYLASNNGTCGLNAICGSVTSASTTYTTNLSVQGSSTAANRGVSTVAIPLSEMPLFNPILSKNTGKITWSFALRINKSSELSPLLANAFNPGAGVSGGLILATDADSGAAIATGSSSGYAVILSGDESRVNAASNNNSITLGYFSGGLTSDGTSTVSDSKAVPPSQVTAITNGTNCTFNKILQVNDVPYSNAVSIIVTYDPATNTWGLSTRLDGSSSLQNPLATTANTYSAEITGVDATFTNATFTNMMMYYNSNATAGIYLDNLNIATSANLAVAQNEISGLNVYPNPVSNGVVYINSTSSDSKSVVVYDVLGKQLLQKVVTNGTVDVSGLNKGVYIMKVTEGAATSTRKIVIE